MSAGGASARGASGCGGSPTHRIRGHGGPRLQREGRRPGDRPGSAGRPHHRSADQVRIAPGARVQAAAGTAERNRQRDAAETVLSQEVGGPAVRAIDDSLAAALGPRVSRRPRADAGEVVGGEDAAVGLHPLEHSAL